MRWLSYRNAGHARLEERQMGECGEKQVIFKTLYSGISRGTESLVYNGLVPPDQYKIMKCPHQLGEISFPVSYGYSCVGEVVKTGSAVNEIEEGAQVFVLHPHAEAGVVDAAMVNALPDGLSPQRAVLSANMETALNAVWDSGISRGSSCAVIGAGVVGLLTAKLVFDETGIQPLVIDIDTSKQETAIKLGFNFAVAGEVNVTAEFDSVFNTSSSGAGLQQAIDLCAFEGQVIEMSWYGNRSVNLKLGSAFHSKRLRIISSQVGHVSSVKRGAVSHAERMQMAMTRLCASDFDCLLEPAIAFDDLPERLPEIFSGENRSLCQVVEY